MMTLHDSDLLFKPNFLKIPNMPTSSLAYLLPKSTCMFWTSLSVHRYLHVALVHDIRY